VSESGCLVAGLLFIYLFIYCMVYTHVKSFTIVKNRKCGLIGSVCVSFINLFIYLYIHSHRLIERVSD